MYTIKANVKYIPRVKVPCPKDGIHVVGKSGAIKGVHSLWFDDKLIPKGANAFFYPLDDKLGIKVYYSFGWFGCAKKKFVEAEYRNMKKLHKLDLAPQVEEIINVRINITYMDKRINAKPLAVVTERVKYPEAIWANYAKGYPYDWDYITEDWHSAKGFLEFREDAKRKIKKAGVKFLGSLKLGDIMPDINKRRWYVVDAGR